MTISEFDALPKEELRVLLTKCCGSQTWVNKMLAVLPADELIDLLEDAEDQWYASAQEDWLEAFSHHPQIGKVETLKAEDASTAEWASSEQSKVADAAEDVKAQLAKANQLYYDKFGYIFIIKATGKTADEMLATLQVRLQNNPETEIEIAMEEQLKITKLRLQKLFE